MTPGSATARANRSANRASWVDMRSPSRVVVTRCRAAGLRYNGRQRLKRFAERDRHPRPVAVTEHELEQQMRKGIARNRHAEVGRMREIDRRFATGDRDLLEEHLGL